MEGDFPRLPALLAPMITLILFSEHSRTPTVCKARKRPLDQKILEDHACSVHLCMSVVH